MSNPKTTSRPPKLTRRVYRLLAAMAKAADVTLEDQAAMVLKGGRRD